MAGGTRLADIKAGYFQECDDLLEELTDGLSALRDPTGTPQERLDLLNGVFRAVHSIKGGAAAFGLNDLTDFAHALETQLMAFRDQGSAPSPTAVPPLDRAVDRLAVLIALAANGTVLSDEERLRDAAIFDDPQKPNGRIEIGLTAQIGDTRQILNGLSALGQVTKRLVLPPQHLDVYDPNHCSLTWAIELESGLSAPELKAALAKLDTWGALERPEPSERTEPKTDTRPDQPAPRHQPTIRVSLDRIDRLVNLVGELVINQAMLARSAQDLGTASNTDHMIGLEDLMRLSRDLQDSVMQIRAQPVKPLFQRMARICRDAAEIAGKSVDLKLEGQDTEIDKTVIERLADPLTHMIRNAVDHAIEAGEDRTRSGKAATGTITLRASHRSGQVIIELSDDGAGIDRDKVLARAKDSGLVPPDADLAAHEIDQLLFRPGFSTSTSVTALSGRGVGMDVVRAAIHGLGGRIAIDSTPGLGTRFEIALPLTLAVLDAMTIRVADQTLVLPLSTIHETITINQSNILELTPERRMLRYNNRAIALVDLGEELGYCPARTRLQDCVGLIIQSEGQPPTALIIDEIYEQRQVVIKGLQDGFQTASCVAAATILGDGRIALIIDPYDPSLLRNTPSEACIPLDLAG